MVDPTKRYDRYSGEMLERLPTTRGDQFSGRGIRDRERGGEPQELRRMLPLNRDVDTGPEQSDGGMQDEMQSNKLMEMIQSAIENGIPIKDVLQAFNEQFQSDSALWNSAQSQTNTRGRRS